MVWIASLTSTQTVNFREVHCLRIKSIKCSSWCLKVFTKGLYLSFLISGPLHNTDYLKLTTFKFKPMQPIVHINYYGKGVALNAVRKIWSEEKSNFWSDCCFRDISKWLKNKKKFSLTRQWSFIEIKGRKRKRWALHAYLTNSHLCPQDWLWPLHSTAHIVSCFTFV